jgi:hypothetical protein
MSTSAKLLKRLARDRSGVAMTELALSLPLLLTVGLYGAETANLTLTHMKVGQVAMHLADNASRIGDTSTLMNRKIYEADINDLLLGAHLQSKGLNFFDRGRAVVSSLEVKTHPAGQQWIRWQRCKGMMNVGSAYGSENNHVTGMGPAGQQVTAPTGGAVIFVEVFYRYEPLVSNRFFGTPLVKTTAAVMVRDNRDLSALYQRNPLAPVPVSRCNGAGHLSSFPEIAI